MTTLGGVSTTPLSGGPCSTRLRMSITSRWGTAAVSPATCARATPPWTTRVATSSPASRQCRMGHGSPLGAGRPLDLGRVSCTEVQYRIAVPTPNLYQYQPASGRITYLELWEQRCASQDLSFSLWRPWRTPERSTATVGLPGYRPRPTPCRPHPSPPWRTVPR